MKENTIKKYLDRLAVAHRYGVKPETVSQWVYLGKIPCIKIPGHRTMFDPEELEKWEREGFVNVR